MEKSNIISGNYNNYDNLNKISDYINNKNNLNNNTKADHIWTESINNTSDVYDSIEEIRLSKEIVGKINENYPNSRIKNVRNVDEIYWAVSPKDALGSDRALVDCHYDAPFAIFPTNNIVFYRVIIACNENYTVVTSFPNDNVKVKMNTGDFHGLDYNKDWHCVEGQIPPGNYRVLLKLHYLVIPELNNEDSISEKFVYYSNVYWTYLSRELMRMSAKPKNYIENIAGNSVNISRYVYNNYKPEIYYGIIFIVILIIHYNKINKEN